MTGDRSPSDMDFSRRNILQATAGTVGLLGLGVTTTSARGGDDYCDETTLRPSMVHYDDSMHEVCEDDHPASQALQAAVRDSLEEHYPTVGALFDAGYFPYFDFFNDGSWSHFINPEFIGDDGTLDFARPESILVDHEFWRPIGVMFIATDRGEPIHPPPVIYRVDEDDRTEQSSDGRNGGWEWEADGEACRPWHAHTGLPGRFSWWKYQKAYEGTVGGLPCRTPWMLHVWIFPHEKSIYAHGAPDERGGTPAEDPGFETDADPTEERLGPEHLPDAVREKVKEMM